MIPELPPGSFYGNSRRRCHASDLSFVESTYPPEFRTPEHSHARAFFYFVLKGTCTEVYEKRTRSACPATLVYHPAGGSHADHWPGAGGRCFHIEVGQATLQRATEHVGILDHSTDFQSGDMIWLATRLYREFWRRDVASSLAMQGLVLELLAQTARNGDSIKRRRPPHWLPRVRDLLHDRFPERLVLDEIAGAVGVHPVHLCRVFRQAYGCTLGDYLRNLRIGFASRRLATSSVPLAEIALAAGFADQSHFTKAFRRATGMTPVAWRRHFRSR
jgi:AraC family transcriptional regulator